MPDPTEPAATAPPPPLPSSVTTVEHEGVTYHLIGTAHVSAQSVADVRSVIGQLKPDVVAVELCKPRYEALSQERSFRDLDVFKVIREGRTLYLLAHLALASYQRRMGAALGVKPGAELLAAVEAGNSAGARVELVDREINLTLRRTWANIGFWKRSMLLASMVVGEDDKDAEPVTAETIEKLKDQKALSSMLDEIAAAYPEVKEPLIDERDRYMASMLVETAKGTTPRTLHDGGSRRGPAKTVVAVVGAAHVPGMRKVFGKPIDRAALDRPPPPSKFWTALKWLIPALFLAGLLWGWQASASRIDEVTEPGKQAHSLFELMMAWIAPTSLGAGGLTLLAGGSLLTVLAAVLVAPIAAVHPLLGTAMVTGLVEAWRRRPSVGDCEALADDIQSTRGFWRNKVTRTLLIAVASGIGTASGFWIGVGVVIKKLA